MDNTRKGQTLNRLLVFFVVLLVAGCNGDSPAGPDSTKLTFFKWGTGSGSVRVSLSQGQYTCTASVFGNRNEHVDIPWNFTVRLYVFPPTRDLANHSITEVIEYEGRWHKDINVDGGTYSLEVGARGSWTVSCE